MIHETDITITTFWLDSPSPVCHMMIQHNPTGKYCMGYSRFHRKLKQQLLQRLEQLLQEQDRRRDHIGEAK